MASQGATLETWQRCRGEWDIWFLLAGRGAGKTLAGSTQVIRHLRTFGRAARVGVMAPTREDARTICMEGVTGLGLYREEFSAWLPSRGFARHYLGGVVYFMSAAQPQRWNGPQWSMLWADELALCNPDSWDQAFLGLRLGERPRAVITTTPKGGRWVRDLSELRPSRVNPLEAYTVVTQATTYDNPHLSRQVLARFEARYGGTTLGRQELLAQWLDYIEGAVFADLHTFINEFLQPLPANLRYTRTGSGIDWGTSLQHQSSIVSGSNEKQGRVIIRRSWKSPKGSSNELAGELGDLQDKIGISFARVDRSQASLMDAIDNLGIEAGYGMRDVEWRIALMLGLIEQRRIIFDLTGDGVRELFDSLCQYHRDDDGKIVEEYDDDVDACLYLVAELEQPNWEPPDRYGSVKLRTRRTQPRGGRATSKGLPGRRSKAA